MSRLLTRGLALLAFLTCSTVLYPHPAAAEDNLGLSLDGVHWHAGLAEPLFDPAVRWVPGDVRTSRFLVRNDAADPADLALDLLRRSDDALIETGWLRVSARAGSGSWTTIAASGTHRLVDEDRIAAGSVVPLQVRVALAPSAPNGTQVLGSDLDLRVTLTDSRANAHNGDNGDNGEGPDQALPDTGLALPWWEVPLGLLLVLGGLLLLAARRRNTEPTDSPDPTDTPELQALQATVTSTATDEGELT